LRREDTRWKVYGDTCDVFLHKGENSKGDHSEGSHTNNTHIHNTQLCIFETISNIERDTLHSVIKIFLEELKKIPVIVNMLDMHAEGRECRRKCKIKDTYDGIPYIYIYIYIY
jgi:hypothetical protein